MTLPPGEPPGSPPAGARPHVRAGERWRTLPTERTVIAVTRTLTSTVRALDALTPALRDDPRVDVLFTHDPNSAFGEGVPELLRAAGVRTLPWAELPHTPCDLLVTATENVDLSTRATATTAPVLVLPHGVGFHKHVPDSRSSADRVSGVVQEELLLSGRAWLALSHPDQADQLAALHRATVGRTLVVGDPAYDQLLAGRALRSAYREALGAADGQRLVTLTSTWRAQSLLGSDPGLPARLLSQLPCDEYRVALVTHPNIRAWHGKWGLGTVLASACEAGLVRVPPVPSYGWQGALLAADVVVGDHGSVTFYAAALGIPVLLASFGEEAVPGTPLAELGRLAPRLNDGEPLDRQVRRAVDEHDRETLMKIGASALAEPGQAADRLREALYGLLQLPQPTQPAPSHRPAHPGAPLSSPALTRRPLPAPEPVEVPARPLTSTVVATAVDGEETEGQRVTVRRFPAPTAPELPDEEPHFRHLAVSEDERDPGLRQSASVLLRGGQARNTTAAGLWARTTLARYPGCLLAAASLPGNGCLVRLRDGRTVTTTATGHALDAGLHAAVVYARLRSGTALEGAVTLRCGAREEDVEIRARP